MVFIDFLTGTVKGGRCSIIKDIVIDNTYFDIKKIAESGQCFRINQIGLNTWECISLGLECLIEKHEYKSILKCRQEDAEYWETYFDFCSTDYESIDLIMTLQSETMNPYTIKAYEYSRGIRVLRQAAAEMVLTYMIATAKQIPQIKACIEKICKCYGEKKKGIAGNYYYSFPTYSDIAKAPEPLLTRCGLGFRAERILKMCQKGIGFDAAFMNYKELREYLMGFEGIGPKVADCIALYGYHKTQAFPVDTHIKEILTREYDQGRKKNIEKIIEEHFEVFGYAKGIVQQFIFYYELFLSKKVA